jgi:hypothetical protein
MLSALRSGVPHREGLRALRSAQSLTKKTVEECRSDAEIMTTAIVAAIFFDGNHEYCL